ncbi:acyltransferase [Aeromonas veronii]|uniref:acyltransferase n=1 Tax=Aeromonas veronii TaxID=654 RepID=UPI001CD670D2|nr:acyltransferase [Aeromonas veronii]UBR44321.1 acyltransferase [Aeromonas veronii]
MLSKIKRFFEIKELCKQGVMLVKPYYIEYSNMIKVNGVCYIGPHFYCSAKGGVNIGENVIIGPKCNIWTYNHNFKYPEMIPYGGDDILKPVVIHDHVWIGLNVTILPGTTIGKGAIISAGSVVRGEIKALSIMAGNPAEVVGYRNEADFHVNEMKNNFYLRKK